MPPYVPIADLLATSVTDAGVKELAPLKKLTTLSLIGTQVTDVGLKELAAFKGLTELSLFGTQVTTRGVKELQKALPRCQIFR